MTIKSTLFCASDLWALGNLLDSLQDSLQEYSTKIPRNPSRKPCLGGTQFQLWVLHYCVFPLTLLHEASSSGALIECGLNTNLRNFGINDQLGCDG